MLIEVLFEGDVADEAHATQAAVELDPAEDLCLCCGDEFWAIEMDSQWLGSGNRNGRWMTQKLDCISLVFDVDGRVTYFWSDCGLAKDG